MAVLDEVGHLLRSLRGVWDEDAVDELDHALQAAARARDDDAGDELLLAALCTISPTARSSARSHRSSTIGSPWNG
jgi:hypothetical protein